MAWATYITDLRKVLSDGATDKPRYRKGLLGPLNGTNVTFQTFEFRRITDFTTAIAPLGVYVNGLPAAVVSDFPDFGQVEIDTAPLNTDTIEASYYVQWFTDDELDTFQNTSAQWLGFSPQTLMDGLKPSALNYAASLGYEKLALKWAENDGVRFRMEDGQDPQFKTPFDNYMKMASTFRNLATKQRDEFYTRQGQSLQPLWGSNTSGILNPVPQR